MKSHFLLPVVLLLLASLPLPSPADPPAPGAARPAEKQTCAVLNFDAQAGITREETAILSERFAIEFGTLGAYQLISRSKMKEVLEMQKFAHSDNCSATECAIEAGKLLSAQFMIYGSVGKLGTTWTVNAALVNVESGAIESQGSVDVDGKVDDLLKSGMHNAARQLAGLAPAVAAPGQARFEKREDISVSDAVYAEVVELIRKNYVKKIDLDLSKRPRMDLLLAQLDDPHTQFMDANLFADLKNDTAGEFGGLGIVIGLRDGSLNVIAPMEDTPAYRAGILHGDKIVAIGGVATENLTLQDAVKLMRGKPGTRVKIKIERAKPREIMELEIARALIKVESVKGATLLADHIGYIRITQFNERTAEELQQALKGLLARGMQSLILDLRDNPGGLIGSAVEVAAKFLKDGQIIASTKGRSRIAEQAQYTAKGKYHYPDFPMVALINQGSAAASEIVASALRDNGRAKLVGDRTFGKGSVQSIIPLSDGSALRLSTAMHYTPQGDCVHKKGIDPDLSVPVAAEEWSRVIQARAADEQARGADRAAAASSPVMDRQLAAAVEYLKGHPR